MATVTGCRKLQDEKSPQRIIPSGKVYRQKFDAEVSISNTSVFSMFFVYTASSWHFPAANVMHHSSNGLNPLPGIYHNTKVIILCSLLADFHHSD